MWVFNALALIFYQQILGLPAGLAATAMALAIIAGAITDPLTGAISDNLRSRFGRRHPFLFTAPIPLALYVFLIFHPPQIVIESTSFLFMWLCLFTILQRTFQTFYVVPHLAMGAELSTDYLERTRLMSFNSLFGPYGGIVMHSVAWFAVFGFILVDQGGQLYRPACTWIALIGCLIIILSIFASALGTYDQIEKLKRNENLREKKWSLRSFYRDIWLVLQNCNYLFLLLGLYFLSLTIGTHETLGIFTVTFFWELTPNQIGFLVANNIIGVHLGFFFGRKLHDRYDKRWTIALCAAGLSVFWSMSVNLTLLGLAPANGSWSLVVFITFFGSFAAFFGASVFLESNERRWPYCCWICSPVLRIAATKISSWRSIGRHYFQVGCCGRPLRDGRWRHCRDSLFGLPNRQGCTRRDSGAIEGASRSSVI